MTRDDRADRGPERSRAADGERSRRAILEAAARLATVEGLDGLSIGRLAEHVGMSKSGLFAHFGSKEELQLATVDAAERVFDEVVVAPALAAPEGLRAAPRRSASGSSRTSSESVFPGGCFFASAAARARHAARPACGTAWPRSTAAGSR